MFKSSKSIELNGTNAKDKTGKGGDAKGGSIPSSPISITVSSSKKAGSGQMSSRHPLSIPLKIDGNNTEPNVDNDESFPPPPDDLLTTKTQDLSPHSPRSPLADTTSYSSDASTVKSWKADVAGPLVLGPTFKATSKTPGVWSPTRRQDDASKMESKTGTTEMKMESKTNMESTSSWQVQQSAKCESTIMSYKMETSTGSIKTQEVSGSPKTAPALPAKGGFASLEGSHNSSTSNQTSEDKKRDGLITKGPVSPPFTRLNGSSHLPRSQSPTITLLQKKREGQIPSGAIYIDNKINKQDDSPNLSSVPPINDNLFQVKSAEVHDDYRKIVIEPIQHKGIGPTEQGVPISLRTGIKEENKGDWYKKMYKSLHRLGDSSEDDYVVVKYRRRGRIPYTGSGYMSEPEPERDDYLLPSKYATLDRRRLYSERALDATTKQEYTTTKAKSVFSAWEPPSAKYSSDIYRNQPRRIEDYEPGHSSIAEREAKLRTNTSKGILSHYKDGYESDSPLVYKKHGSEKLSSFDQKVWYREIQRGGDIPLTGLRRPLPDSPKESTSSPPIRLSHSSSIENTSAPFDLSLLPPVPAPPPKIPLVDGGSESPHKYVESEVNIHYKAPIRLLEKDYIEEEELKKKQEAMMKQFYEDEKRKRFIQEMNDIENRRHSDNFVPNQKSPIPLDRYDNPFEPSVSPQPRARTPEPKTVARALFNFTAQNARELSFSKSDIIIIRRRIDRNWFEGEHHGMVGLFPVNHVEIIPYDNVRATPKKINEGLAKAKYHFRAQTSLELSLVKGELIILTRRVDNNWYMGRIGGREGIIPVSYLEVIREPGDTNRLSVSPILKSTVSPTNRSAILNGTATIHSYNQPNYYNQKSTPAYQNPYATMRRYAPIRPPDPTYVEKKQPVDQSLHIDTQSEPIPYRALYDYQPQNEDELELQEGDTVFVMEKCDDGWYVGSSLRTGFFGTFPGNYVERMCK